MKIVKASKSKVKGLKLSQVKMGDCFVFKNIYYMKIGENRRSSFDINIVVNLSTGRYEEDFDEDLVVTPVEIEAIVYEN